MTLRKFYIAFIFLFTGAISGPAQAVTGTGTPVRTPERVSETLAAKLEAFGSKTASRENREAAFAKLLEGQRYSWAASRTRSSSRAGAAIRVARQAFQAAVELDPKLAEGYTALAELEISQSPSEAQVDEAIDLAKLAVRVNPDNFGARRLMARLYSYKAKVGNAGNFDAGLGEKAAAEWKEVTRLDPRNVEAWAFLAAIYERQEKDDLHIDALRKWIAGVAPIDTQFYRFVMGSSENLSPENASMKLGAALLEAGKTKEAIDVLSTIVADDPSNVAAIELLRSAVEANEAGTATAAIEALQQAVYANGDNLSLLNLLARVYARAGRVQDAIRLYESAISRIGSSDPVAVAEFQTALGDLYADNDEYEKAAAAYERALSIRGFGANSKLQDEERVFAMQLFEKLINVHKRQNSTKDVIAVIERARKLLGEEDLFADRLLISYYREEGRRKEALDAVRSVRVRYPEDQGFLRLEATLLTELGRVDEAVAVFRKGSEPKTGSDGAPIATDEFSNHLFISSLYTQANRGKEAADAANSAYAVARGNERKQIAKLTLATALNQSGDKAGAEATLREILKQSPDNPIALNNLGYFLVERGEMLEQAKDMIEKAVNIDPTNPSYLDSLGWAYFKLGNYTEAERHLSQAARYNSGSATIQEHLGDVYEKLGKREQAKTAWQRALKVTTDPEDIKRLKAKLK
ncbi:MAG: tetratricopeptide repeat protein [Pyrinomonadaceae bacterium]|nr:tetratricopeptide repeat protein [Pyrinomonadaceae bacterium]